MNKLLLNGIWKMSKKGDNRNTYNATIPGSLYSTLLENNVIEHPFYRDNEKKVTKLSQNNYTFQRKFDVNSDFLKQKSIKLICEGLDTLADVYLNNKLLIKADNMHLKYEKDIKALLVKGENNIRIEFSSPIEYITKKNKEYKLFSVDKSHALQGYAHLRKAHCMFGWDWGPKLPDMGIWRDIYIIGENKALLKNAKITQKHSNEKVEVVIDTEIEMITKENYRVEVIVYDPKGNKIHTTSKSYDKDIKISLSDPKLWWPNGLGKQNLYNFEIKLIDDDSNIVHSKSYKIGLRTLNVKRQKDKWGTSFNFTVNGCDIFAMGADYIPEDSIFSNFSYDKTKKLLEDCKKSNFNTIRVWGGGYYPDDYFYDLCDEFGLIVWQDLMFACATYRIDDKFEKSIRKEAKQNIERIRHHASLGIISGNNEMEWFWNNWDVNKLAVDKPKIQKADYIKQFEYILKKEVQKATDILYWPSSPSSFGSFDEPNSPDHGDVHDWTVWHSNAPYSYYRTTTPRFLSEFGMQSFPCIETVNSFTIKEDRNVFSKVMENHQKNNSGNNLIMGYIAQNYKYPHGFDNLLYISQLNQAEAIKYACEHYRRIRPRCMGAVYWQLNDCWPVASWSSIDYYGRWKALNYFAKNFFNPILCSVCEDENSVSIHLNNNTRDNFNGFIEYYLKDFDGKILHQNKIPVNIKALSTIKVSKENYTKLLDKHDRQKTYFSYKLISDSKTVNSGTVFFTKIKYLNLKKPIYNLSLNKEDNEYSLELKSSELAKNVELKAKNNTTVFSDNYFDLEPNITKTLTFKSSETIEVKDIKIRSVYDTYEK